ncbi:MAG: hypothetical protein QOG52_2840, partial [Frankiaceae bacterium]|nr:hypothetical protein [Frankiaceae bacterium]
MRLRLVSPLLVGRSAEMAVLEAALSRAAGGDPAVVIVGGEAGVGKSRVLVEFTDVATAAGGRVLAGQCVEVGGDGTPFAPVVDMLRTLARTTPAAELEELLGRGKRELARLLPELDPDPGSPAAYPPAGDSGTSAQMFELLLGLFARLSVRQPLVLVLEDLHWADQSTLDFFAFLARTMRGTRILLVATYRSDEMHRRHPLRPLLSTWERSRDVTRLELDRFDRAEVAAQLSAILGTAPADALVDVVFERSDGNAFLVEEMLGIVEGDVDPRNLPQSLRDVLLARVDQLSPDAQRVLRTAAVAGRWVPERLLAAVARLDEPTLYAGLREAVEHHLLIVEAAGRGYTFRHALARDAVYEDMLPGERGALHLAYGEVLSADPSLASDPTSLAATLAAHWYAALDLPRTLTASVEAARQASAAYASTEAQRHLERAIEVWPRVPDAEERAGLTLVDLLLLTSDASFR